MIGSLSTEKPPQTINTTRAKISKYKFPLYNPLNTFPRRSCRPMLIGKQKPPICYRLHKEAAVQCRSSSKNLQYVNGSNYLAGTIVDGLKCLSMSAIRIELLVCNGDLEVGLESLGRCEVTAIFGVDVISGGRRYVLLRHCKNGNWIPYAWHDVQSIVHTYKDSNIGANNAKLQGGDVIYLLLLDKKMKDFRYLCSMHMILDAPKHTLVSIFRGRLIEDAGNVKVGRDLHNATISLSFSRRPVRGALKLRRGSTRSTTIINCWSSKVDISSFFATIMPNTNTNPALNFEAQVHSAPSSLGALTYQPEAQAPTERNIVEEPRGLLGSVWLAFQFGWQLIVLFCTFLAGHILPTLFAQGEAEEDISDPSTPISVFSAQEEVEEDNSNPSSPLSAFSAQEEAEEDSSDPSSPLSVTLPPEDEIGPATPSPQQVPRTPSIRSPQPIPSTLSIPEYSRSLDLFTIFAALVIGYATSVIGGIISMDLFLNDLSRTIYYKAMKAYENDFCVYRNGLLLLLGASIGLSSLISLFIALIAYVKWGRRRPILLISVIMGGMGLCLIFWNPNAGTIATGMVFTGAGVGGLLMVVQMVIAEAQSRTSSLFDYITYGGSFLAYLINFFSQNSPRYCWRIPIWVLCGLGLPLVITCFFVREAPKQPTPLVTSIKKLLEPRRRPKLTITTVSGVLNQLQGMSTLMFFAPLLLESSSENYSVSEAFSAPLLLAAIWGVCIVIAGGLIRLRGARRTLLIIASATTLTSLKSDSIYAIALAVLYTVGHACLYGPHGWITEPYPLEAKDVGSILGPALSSLMAVVMQMSSLYLTCALGEYVFLFMAGISLITGCFIGAFVPETIGISNDEIIENIWRRHWFWRNFMNDEVVSA
ncbi:hypothetical protein LguiB_018479 [Lonicera macranthoides]